MAVFEPACGPPACLRWAVTWDYACVSHDDGVPQPSGRQAEMVERMPSRFIPYTPDIEAASPGFDEMLQTVIAKTERFIAESVDAEGTGLAVRDAHAKGYGIVRGEVEILD